MSASQIQDDIISFMFLRDQSGALDVIACLKLWFGKDNLTDALIRDRFGAWVERALAGALDIWMETPRGALALMILVDQFPRNIFRHTVEMFAGDARARRIVDSGHDWLAVLRPEECLFVPCLILTHQENLADQEQCVEFFSRLEPRLDKSLRIFRVIFEEHLRIIDLVGSFPHRDHYYGRPTSAVGRKLLDNPKLRFDLPLIVDGGGVHFGYDPLKLWAATEHAFEAVERLDELTDEHLDHGFGSIAPSWLTPKQIAEVKETFRLFDVNGDNLLDVDELTAVLASYDRHYRRDRLQSAVDRITGEHGSPGLQFDQFAALLRTDMSEDWEKRLRRRFCLFDHGGKGYLTEDDLLSCIHGMDELVTTEEVHDMMKLADADHHGRISYQDFLRLMRTLADVDAAEAESR
jgi:uncharacterized protein (DUF924 family)/Ca2+-binding EF-hand superfamily protein